jgi:hypothetical protein
VPTAPPAAKAEDKIKGCTESTLVRGETGAVPEAA